MVNICTGCNKPGFARHQCTSRDTFEIAPGISKVAVCHCNVDYDCRGWKPAVPNWAAADERITYSTT